MGHVLLRHTVVVVSCGNWQRKQQPGIDAHGYVVCTTAVWAKCCNLSSYPDNRGAVGGVFIFLSTARSSSSHKSKFPHACVKTTAAVYLGKVFLHICMWIRRGGTIAAVPYRQVVFTLPDSPRVRTPATVYISYIWQNFGVTYTHVSPKATNYVTITTVAAV